MTVLLSIKPEYADKIFDGTKKFEYRRTIFKREDVKKILVYASSPIQKIIGEFEIASLLKDYTEYLWQETSEHSGITKQFYDEYFKDKMYANAIEVGEVTKYDDPKTLADFNIKTAPQSFVYIEEK